MGAASAILVVLITLLCTSLPFPFSPLRMSWLPGYLAGWLDGLMDG